MTFRGNDLVGWDTVGLFQSFLKRFYLMEDVLKLVYLVNEEFFLLPVA
jgi:hypothetical protein